MASREIKEWIDKCFKNLLNGIIEIDDFPPIKDVTNLDRIDFYNCVALEHVNLYNYLDDRNKQGLSEDEIARLDKSLENFKFFSRVVYREVVRVNAILINQNQNQKK